MAIEYLQTITLPVTDQDRAKHFYVDILAWDLLSDEVYEGPDGEQHRWLEVRPPKGQTAIILVASSTVAQNRENNLTLRASDLEQTVGSLGDQGVAVDKIGSSPLGKFTKFKDPDDNVWTIQEIAQ